MSYREKGAWAELVSTLAIWGFYFVSLSAAVTSGQLESEGFAGAMGGHFIGSVVLSVIVGIGLGVLVEITSRKADRAGGDEREAWAGLRATRIAHAVLFGMILILSAVAFLVGAFAGQTVAERANETLALLLSNGLVLFANAALAALVIAEITHYGALIFFLRRGR